jgi:hypothetical protein
MVQVMLCPSTKTTLSMHLGPMLCQELWKRWTGAVHLPSLVSFLRICSKENILMKVRIVLSNKVGCFMEV